ncbi:hypothetical protein DITRI_Ditri03aG0015700 [Diplodiscus trichospermus]
MGEANETFEDFRRVKSELVSSQKSLASSRQQMEQQEQLLETQLEELDEQKRSVASYMEKGTDRRATGVEERERSSLHQAIQDVSFLRQQLEQKNAKFGEMSDDLQSKEADLAEAKLEIQHLKSEQASLQLILEEKDLELSNARKKLKQVNQEIAEVKMILSSKEHQLIQDSALLKEKVVHVQKVQDELNDPKIKLSEAETVIERITELSNRLVISVKDEDNNLLRPVGNTGDELIHQLVGRPPNDFKLQKKRLETELKFTKESLKVKEMEVLDAQRALRIKDEELKMVLGRLEARENEVQRLKEEMAEDANDMRKFYALAQERIGKKSVGDLAIEKLQLEATQLGAEAATTSLQKLADMSHELLNKDCMSIEADYDTCIFLQSNSDPMVSMIENNECFSEVKTGLAKLLALTEQLVKDAAIVSAHRQS